VKTFQLDRHSKEEMDHVKSEVQIYLCLDHPHIARLHAVYENEQHIHLVMECLEGGRLLDRVKEKGRFSEEEARDAIRQMLLALNYMHSHGMVHRDVKLENFVFDRKDGTHLKMIDFGFSTMWSPETENTMAQTCGTRCYCAPEVFCKDYTSQCDLWSLGVVGFLLLSGGMPFSGVEMQTKIRTGTYVMKPERWMRVSSQAQSFIKSLLKVNPASRLTAQQALEHSWILNGLTVQPDLTQMANGLLEFSRASHFRRCCMKMLALSLPHEDQVETYSQFLSLDTERTGTIKLIALRTVITEKLHITEEQEVLRIFAALDYNHDQEIHYSDFLAAMLGAGISIGVDTMRHAFQRFDNDGSGCITVQDLRNVLGHVGETCINPDIQEDDPLNEVPIRFEDFADYLSPGLAADLDRECEASLYKYSYGLMFNNTDSWCPIDNSKTRLLATTTSKAMTTTTTDYYATDYDCQNYSFSDSQSIGSDSQSDSRDSNVKDGHTTAFATTTTTKLEA
jgi:calcium-dependent protein kinase